MKIAIAGVSGLVGGAFSRFMTAEGHEIIPIGRELFKGSPQLMAQRIEGCSAVYNFVGAPVIKRWTKRWKQEILNSRVSTTSHLVHAFEFMLQKPTFFFNASAIGIYDYEHDHDEQSDYFGDGFLAKVVSQWEEEANKAHALNIRVVTGRIGVVLDRHKAALPKLLMPFRFGIGGPLGSGKQIVSFIHIEDLVQALDFVRTKEVMQGAVNLVAPNYSSNAEISEAIGRILKRPAFFRTPKFVLYLVLGKAAEVIIGGERVLPGKLRKAKFNFQFPNVQSALSDLLS